MIGTMIGLVLTGTMIVVLVTEMYSIKGMQLPNYMRQTRSTYRQIEEDQGPKIELQDMELDELRELHHKLKGTFAEDQIYKVRREKVLAERDQIHGRVRTRNALTERLQDKPISLGKLEKALDVLK